MKTAPNTIILERTSAKDEPETHNRMQAYRIKAGLLPNKLSMDSFGHIRQNSTAGPRIGAHRYFWGLHVIELSTKEYNQVFVSLHEAGLLVGRETRKKTTRWNLARNL